MNREEPSPKAATPDVLETYGGGYHRFESRFVPRIESPPAKKRAERKKTKKKKSDRRDDDSGAP
jgi:hypothetical protein